MIYHQLLDTKLIRDMFEYKIENNEVTITGYKDQFVKSIIIPDMIDGYPVTKISSKAFVGRNNLKHLTIPNSVIDIGYKLGCKKLKFVNNIRLNDNIIINNRFLYYCGYFCRVIYVIDRDYYFYRAYRSWGLFYMVDGVVYSL